MQAMGSMATNRSVHTDTTVSDFYCDMDFNSEVIFDAVAGASCELTYTECQQTLKWQPN